MKAATERTILSARRVRRTAVDLWQKTCGAVALEYGLIAALIALAILTSLYGLRDALVGLPLQSLIDAFVAAIS